MFFFTKKSKDEVIYSLGRKAILDLISEWKWRSGTYAKDVSKMTIVQLRNELKKIRKRMKNGDVPFTSMAHQTGVKTDKAQMLLDRKANMSSQKEKRVVKKHNVLQKKEKIGKTLPVLSSSDNSITLTPRTTDSTIRGCKKATLCELVKTWMKIDKSHSVRSVNDLDKSGLIKEVKKIRKNLTKKWNERYLVSLKTDKRNENLLS